MLDNNNEATEGRQNEENHGQRRGKVEEEEYARKPPGTEMANGRHFALQPQLQTWLLSQGTFPPEPRWGFGIPSNMVL